MLETSPGNDIISTNIEITNIRGLHARASAKFVTCAQQFQSKIRVQKDQNDVSGTSIMGLMMLAASKGCSIEISAEGPDARDAINALEELISNKFDEIE